jgi:hypothetical protein
MRHGAFSSEAKRLPAPPLLLLRLALHRRRGGVVDFDPMLFWLTVQPLFLRQSARISRNSRGPLMSWRFRRARSSLVVA